MVSGKGKLHRKLIFQSLNILGSLCYPNENKKSLLRKFIYFWIIEFRFECISISIRLRRCSYFNDVTLRTLSWTSFGRIFRAVHSLSHQVVRQSAVGVLLAAYRWNLRDSVRFRGGGSVTSGPLSRIRNGISCPPNSIQRSSNNADNADRSFESYDCAHIRRWD